MRSESRLRGTLGSSIVMAICACGGPATEPAAPTPPPAAAASVAVVMPAPPPPPGPPEPARLTAVQPPAEVCALSGDLDDDALELAGRPDAPGFLVATTGRAKLSLGAGGAAFAEVSTAGIVARGHIAEGTVAVRTKRWLSFGGVVFPGTRRRVRVKDARDGRLVVSAPLSALTLEVASRTAELPCDAVTLATDPDGVLARELPLAFAAKGPTRAMQLAANTRTPLAAEPGGAPTATLDADDRPMDVTVLEQRGARAHIRAGHAAGWIDARLLRAPTQDRTYLANSALDDELTDTAVLGDLLGSATSPVRAAAAPETSEIVCPRDVRVLVEYTRASRAAGERYVIGTIPAGATARVGDKTDELFYLAPDQWTGLRVREGARLAIPARDALGCAAGPLVVAAAAPPPPVRARKLDAIDALAPPPSAPGRFAVRLVGATSLDNPTAQRVEVTPGVRRASPSLRQGALQVSGGLPPEVIERIARQSFGGFRRCYENGLRTNSQLRGRVTIRFVIDKTGAVSSAADAGSELPDQGVVSCVARALGNLAFPQPEGAGSVVVTYPIVFDPGPP